MNLNNSAHIFLQQKGGIGKTLTASMFMQYMKSQNIVIEGVDADPQAPKLSLIQALNVPLLPLIANGEIQQNSFDPAFSHIVQSNVATLVDSNRLVPPRLHPHQRPMSSQQVCRNRWQFRRW